MADPVVSTVVDPTKNIKPAEATVIRHLVSGSSKTIIHLYLVHPTDRKLDPKEVPFAKKIALEQYQLAEKIIEAGKLQLFYGDGLDSNTAREMSSSFNVKRPFFTIPEALRVNSQFMLMYTGRKVGGAESSQALDDFQNQIQSQAAVGEVSSVTVSKMAHKRETAIIQNLMSTQTPVDMIILGGTHRLLQEVQEWNKSNSKKKISLIEVIPKSIPTSLPKLDDWIQQNFPNYGR
jgi:hypothetical protein